jgi:hypothetical protein
MRNSNAKSKRKLNDEYDLLIIVVNGWRMHRDDRTKPGCQPTITEKRCEGTYQ